MNTATSPHARQYFLDWLRILAFALLVPYHVGMYYVSWGWHVKSATLYPGLEPFMMLSSPWRLGLLFLIAGAASQSLMQRSGIAGQGFLRSRSKRLLWPLLFGMLVIVPPQAYFEAVTKVPYAGSYGDFMRLYVQGYGGLCDRDGCLTLPTWNHLWFLPYLWVYSLLGYALLRSWPGLIASAERALTGPHGGWRVLVVLALPLMAARSLVALFPSTHNLTWDWYNHAQYGWLFLLGLLAARSELWEQMRRQRHLALGLAAGAWLLVQLYFHHYQDLAPPESLRMAQRALFGAMQWWSLVAIGGYAKQHLDRDHAWRASLNRAIFCVYILHQTLIVLLTRALLPLQLPAALEGVLLILLTLALSGLGYLLVRRVPVLNLLMGVPGSNAPAEQKPARASTMAHPSVPLNSR